MVFDILALPDERERARSTFAAFVSGGTDGHYENHWRSKDGADQWIAWTNALVYGKDDTCYVVGTGVEISRQKGVEDALRLSEQKSKAILNALPDLMFRIRSDGTFLDYYAHDETELFAPASQFLDRRVSDILPPELAQLTMGFVQKALDTGLIQVYEYQVLAEHETHYESRLVPNGPDEVLSIIRNITDRKQSESALHRREAILEAVGFAADHYLAAHSWQDGIVDVLGRLGCAADVDRVALFQNSLNEHAQKVARLIHLWSASPDVPGPLPGSDFSMDEWSGFGEFREAMQKSEPVYLGTSDPKDGMQHLAEALSAASVVVVPVYAGEDWWGFICFGDAAAGRPWHSVEVESLKAASNILGSAIRRFVYEKVRLATLRVSEAAHSARDLDELYRAIHQIVYDLMPAQNFYIALYNADADLISFPYDVDEFDDPFPPQKPGRGLTEYVLRTGEPLLASPDVFNELLAKAEVDAVGSPSIDWLGVPLKTADRTIGVLAVQSYTEDIRFNIDDMQMLTFVSTQVAMAIERKLADEQLRVSEERYRTLVENIPIGVYRVSADGRILMANPAFRTIFGCESEQVFQDLHVDDLFVTSDDRRVFENLVRSQGSVSSVDLPLRRWDGGRIWGSLTASMIADHAGQILYYDCAIEDITVRSQRAKEREALISFAAIIRSEQSRKEIVTAILDYLGILVGTDSLAFVISDITGEHLWIEEARGYWEYLLQRNLPINERLCREIISNRTLYQDNQTQNDPLFSPSLQLSVQRAVMCVPLTTENRGIGAIWLGRERHFQEEDAQLLVAIADIAASALHRTMLHEQTQLRVQRLSALRAIDMAISASMDLRVVLNVLLEQVRLQLTVDAAAVLVLKHHLQSLECVAGNGFHTSAIQNTRLHLSDKISGRSILDQKSMRLDDMSSIWGEFLRSRGLEGEDFLAYHMVPLIAKGQLVGALEVFSRGRLSSDREWVEFLEMLAGQAAIAMDNAVLFNELQRSNMELHLAYDSTLEGWVRAMDLRLGEEDRRTKMSTEMTLMLGKALGMSEGELVHLRRGALLHDIGNMAITDAILLKPGPLTDVEWAVIHKHPVYAKEMLGPIAYLKPALAIPYYHHEHWDGSGYPNGCKAAEIPLAARLFAIVDVWCSLRSKRPYRDAWSEGDALDYLREQAGKQLDPDLVNKFIGLLNAGAIANRL